MAVSLDVAEKNLEDLEKEVTCAVCQEHYTDPKILPCLHYYCKQCILRLALRTGKDKPFSCPECCKDTTLPEGGVEELKSAFFINRFKSIYEKHKKALSKQVQCEICTNPEALAEGFCSQCDKFVCKHCMQQHVIMKAVFDGHEIISVEQMKKMKLDDLAPKRSPSKKCPVHDELLKIFCFDCSKLICRDCTVKDHKDHNIEFNNVAADKKKKELMESLKPLRKVEDSLSRALEEVSNTECEVEGQGDSVVSTIEASFEELHTILETRKQQLLEESKRRVKEKIEKLKGQEKNLSISNARVRSVIDYTEQCVRHCSDEEVMSMHTEMSRRIQEEVEEHSKAGSKVKPVEEADMGVEVRCAEKLQQLCLKVRIKVLQRTDYLKISSIPSTAEINKDIEVEIVDTYNKKPSAKSVLNLDCEVKRVSAKSVCKPSIKTKNPGTYEISYTPSVHGRHELLISAYSQPVAGSPFTMTVYISPAQLDKPVKVWGGVTGPFSVAVNSLGEIVVAEYYGDVVVFSNNGKILRTIKFSQHKINKLQSIAVDYEDNIYITGTATNKVGKCNRLCEHLRVFDLPQIKSLSCITVIGEEVMLTEVSNEGCILVYDRDLNYIRQISSKNKTTLRHLYPDHHGNLYVSDSNGSIQVLSKTGDFIRTFSRDHNGVQILEYPMMVYVFGQYVYVADFVLEETVVFTTDGNYVTTIPCFGGICINHEGVLYICDFVNNKINCY